MHGVGKELGCLKEGAEEKVPKVHVRGCPSAWRHSSGPCFSLGSGADEVPDASFERPRNALSSSRPSDWCPWRHANHV